jgi:fucose permease
MPIGMLGAGWPEARDRFGQSTGALALVAAGYGIGRLVTSPSALPILRRWHIRRANAAFAVALAGCAAVVGLSSSYAVLVVAMAAIGALSGCLDSIGNRYQTVVRDVGSAGLMFGSFGIGSTLGPAVVALTDWTAGYLVAAAIAVGAAALATSRRVAWPDALDVPEPPRAQRAPLRLSPWVVALSLSLFAVYCGIEVVTANWAASYLEAGRGLSGDGAAWAMSGFWAGMTLGRLLLGRLAALGRGVRPPQLLITMASAVAVLYVALPLVPASLAPVVLALGGFALAGAFPTLMSTTADRVGIAATGVMAGRQLLVANLSATGLTLLVGAGIDRIGPGVVAATLAGLGVIGLPLLLRTLAVHPDEVEAISAPAAAP